MTGTHHLDPITYLRATRAVDDGRGRPARRSVRLWTLVRSGRERDTAADGIARHGEPAPAGAAR